MQDVSAIRGIPMTREEKEAKIMDRISHIKDLSDIIIDILYGILF